MLTFLGCHRCHAKSFSLGLLPMVTTTFLDILVAFQPGKTTFREEKFKPTTNEDFKGFNPWFPTKSGTFPALEMIEIRLTYPTVYCTLLSIFFPKMLHGFLFTSFSNFGFRLWVVGTHFFEVM